MTEPKRCMKKETRKVEKRHRCTVCLAEFSFPNKLRNHIRAFHSLSHACEHCDARFDRFNELRTHTAFAHHTRYKCHICAYSSSVKAELKKHIVVNHENGVSCTIDGCNTTIAYRMLKKHIREVHAHQDVVKSTQLSASGDVSEKGRCDGPNSIAILDSVSEAVAVDGKSVDSVSLAEGASGSSLCTASVTSGSISPIPSATSCSCSLTSGSTSARSFPSEIMSCPVEGCSKTFRRMSDLTRHRLHVHKILTGAEEMEYKHQCEHPGCERRFPSMNRLRQHIASHGDGLLVSCMSCNRIFKNRANFAVHLRRYHLMSIRDVNYSPLFVTVSASESSIVEGAA